MLTVVSALKNKIVTLFNFVEGTDSGFLEVLPIKNSLSVGQTWLNMSVETFESSNPHLNVKHARKYSNVKILYASMKSMPSEYTALL